MFEQSGSWITTRSPQGSPRFKEPGPVSSLPNLIGYLWRCGVRDHKQRPSESLRRYRSFYIDSKAAGAAGLESTASCLTGRRSNQQARHFGSWCGIYR